MAPSLMPNYGTSGYGSGLFGNEPIENQPIGYYLALLTSEYQAPTSPKTRAFLQAMLQKFDDASQCLVTMDLAWDLDTAVGVQLDTLGQIAGVSRVLPFQPSGGLSPILGDSDYRLLIKAQIAQNQWDGTIDSLQTIWQSLFPGGSITIFDHQDMTANILVSGAFSSIVLDMINNGLIVPRPEGVLYNYGTSNLPIFGFNGDGVYIAGFDQGKWS
jgi:hypothetical protein